MDNSCDKFFPLLNDYIDNQLDINDKKEIEIHLNECINCNRELKQIKSTINQLKILKNIVTYNDEDDLSSSIIRRLKENTSINHNRSFTSLKYVVASFLVVGLSLFIIFYAGGNNWESKVNNSEDLLLAEYANDYYSIIQPKDNSLYYYDLDTLATDGN